MLSSLIFSSVRGVFALTAVMFVRVIVFASFSLFIVTDLAAAGRANVDAVISVLSVIV